MSSNFVDVKIEGLENLDNTLDRYMIPDYNIKKAIKEVNSSLEEVVKNKAPYETGYTRENVKSSVKEVDGEIGGVITGGGWDRAFIDWGTSKVKNHINWFEKSIDTAIDELQAFKPFKEINKKL